MTLDTGRSASVIIALHFGMWTPASADERAPDAL
jgi:hypothetical protein